MKSRVFTAFLVMILMAMATFTLNCATIPGDPGNPINKGKPGTDGNEFEVSLVYDQALADKAKAAEANGGSRRGDHDAGGRVL